VHTLHTDRLIPGAGSLWAKYPTAGTARHWRAMRCCMIKRRVLLRAQAACCPGVWAKPWETPEVPERQGKHASMQEATCELECRRLLSTRAWPHGAPHGMQVDKLSLGELLTQLEAEAEAVQAVVLSKPDAEGYIRRYLQVRRAGACGSGLGLGLGLGLE